MSSKQKFLLLGIVLIAVFLRFYNFQTMPGGLFPDEAANGLDINLMQQGHLQPFYERGNGREALFFYMEWASTAIFGKGQWQFKIVSELVGVLSVWVCFIAARRLFLMDVMADDEERKNRATNIALLAAFLLAVSTWAVAINHVAFRANLIPLFSGLTIYFLLCTYQAKTNSRKLLFAFLAGAAFALGFYTYIAFRIMAPILIAAIGWPWLAKIRNREFWKTAFSYKTLFFSFLIAFVVFIYPIAKYFYTHPGSFVGRAGQVSVFNPELYTYNGQQLQGKPPLGVVLNVVAEVAKTQLTGFFTKGDLNWRQNVSGYPLISPLYSIFFGIGLILVTWLAIRYFFAPNKKSGWWKFFLLGLWFWGMFLPVVTTAEGIPHGLRGIGMMLPAFIISAWALYVFAQIIMKLHRRLWKHVSDYYKNPKWMKETAFVPPRMRLVNFGLKLVVVCFFLALTLQTYFLFYVYAANSPDYYYSFRADLTSVSEYLRTRCDKSHTYLVLDGYSVQTTDYLTSDPKGNFNDSCNVPYHQVDPEHAWQLKGLTPQDEIVFTQSSMFDTKKFKQYHPNFHLVREDQNKFQQSVMAIYKMAQ